MHNIGSWQRFIRQRVDRNFTARRLVDALSQTKRDAPLSAQNQGQMGWRTINSRRELGLCRLFEYEFGQQSPAIWLGGEHPASLPLAKLICQAFLCHWELDMGSKILNPWGMAKSPIKGRGAHRRTREPTYVREWIAALNETPTAVAKAIKRNQGYLTQIMDNAKKPSYQIMCEIADYLKVPVDYLRRQPPAIPIGDFDAETIARLTKRRH